MSLPKTLLNSRGPIHTLSWILSQKAEILSSSSPRYTNCLFLRVVGKPKPKKPTLKYSQGKRSCV